MNKTKVSIKAAGVLALAGAGMLAIFPASMRADEMNKKTTFTFSGPVEIPGQVLPAGTYVFKLADSQSDRNIVQVFNKDQDHIYGTFLTIPDYRLTPRGKTVMTFEERASGTPQAVKAWFYPGDLYGNEFVYPKAKAVELARRTHHAVPSMPEEVGVDTRAAAKTMQEPEVLAMKQAPIAAENPNGNDVTLAEVFQTTPPAGRSLPTTASPVPLFALLGLLALGGGATLLVAARSNA